MQEVWGCKQKTKLLIPTFYDLQNGILYKYWNCPVKFIPDSVFEFLKIRNYYQKYQGAQMPSFDEVDNRFLTMDSFYTNELNLNMEQQHGK